MASEAELEEIYRQLHGVKGTPRLEIEGMSKREDLSRPDFFGDECPHKRAVYVVAYLAMDDASGCLNSWDYSVFDLAKLEKLISASLDADGESIRDRIPCSRTTFANYWNEAGAGEESTPLNTKEIGLVGEFMMDGETPRFRFLFSQTGYFLDTVLPPDRFPEFSHERKLYETAITAGYRIGDKFRYTATIEPSVNPLS